MESISQAMEEEIQMVHQEAMLRREVTGSESPKKNMEKKPNPEFTEVDAFTQAELEAASCKRCRDFHFLRVDAKIGEPQFGLGMPCPDCSIQQEYTFDGYEGVSGSQRALAACREYATGEGKPWLLISGDVGTGKTHLAMAVRREWQIRVQPTRVTTIPELLETLRASYKSENHQEVLREFTGRDFLVLDDFGASENITAWGREQLYIIINARYRLKSPTVFTTNLDSTRIMAEYGERIASRMNDKSMTVQAILTCADYRPTRRVK